MSAVKNLFKPPKVKRPKPPPEPPTRADARNTLAGGAPTGSGKINPSLISTSTRGALSPARTRKRALIGGGGG